MYSSKVIRYITIFILYGATVDLIGGDIEPQKDRLVCYFPKWARYRTAPHAYTVKQVDARLCTHILYAFNAIDKTGTLFIDPTSDVALWTELRRLKRDRPDLKILMSVGGAESAAMYTRMIQTQARISAFVDDVVNTVIANELDGVDIDWEFPNATQKNLFTELLRRMRTSLDANKPNLLLTTAVTAAPTLIHVIYDLSSITSYVDFFNVMTYDLRGTWNGHTGIHAPLRPLTTGDQLNVEYVVGRYLELGVAPELLVLGVPAYGRSFSLNDTQETGVGAPITGKGKAGPSTADDGILAYYEICEHLTGKDSWSRQWSTQQVSPYASHADQWVGYDDPASVWQKAQFALEQKLGGLMFWDISMDDWGGRCGTGAYPLLDAARSDPGTYPYSVSRAAAPGHTLLQVTTGLLLVLICKAFGDL